MGGNMNYGFVKVAAAVPELKVAGCFYNAEKIIEMSREAESSGSQIVVCPELSLTAYTCADLFQQHLLLREAIVGLGSVTESTKSLKLLIIVGFPLLLDNQLFNCAAVIQKGRILGIVPKTYIPGYREFYEERWFAPGTQTKDTSATLFGKEIPFGTDLLFESEGPEPVCFGIEICEDLWAPIPPSSYQAIAGATILFNLSASNEVIGKAEYRRDLVRLQSGKCAAAYVYVSSGIDESTTDVVFGGHAMIAENGSMLAESERFLRNGHITESEIDIRKLLNERIKNTSFMEERPNRCFRKIDFCLERQNYSDPKQKAEKNQAFKRYIDPHPFVPSDKTARDTRCKEIFAIQTAGLAKRLSHAGIKNVVIGISGGLDSTLALIVAAKTFDILNLPRENITAITMPGFGTTDNTYDNAVQLIGSFHAEFREINIKQACLQHFESIGHDPSVHDVTYENVQARERTQILMDIANKQNGLVIGTGDLSETGFGLVYIQRRSHVDVFGQLRHSKDAGEISCAMGSRQCDRTDDSRDPASDP
jgi:NAD+ synthase (glutamine-hydrolysing)